MTNPDKDAPPGRPHETQDRPVAGIVPSNTPAQESGGASGGRKGGVMATKAEKVILQLTITPNVTAREIARALGFIDGRDVATILKNLARIGSVAATPERLDGNGLPVRTRYRLTSRE